MFHRPLSRSLPVLVLLSVLAGSAPGQAAELSRLYIRGPAALEVNRAFAAAARLGLVASVADDVQAVAWVVFLGIAYRSGIHERGSLWGFRWAGLAVAALTLFVLASDVERFVRPALEHTFFLAGLYGRVALCVGGLVLVEALLRQARADGSWRVRYLCLGVGGWIGFDLFRLSETLLFQRVDPFLDAGRAAVSLVVAPLIAVAAARNPGWSAELNVARRAVFQAATVYGIAIYLIAIAAIGAALQSVGGDWGRLLQAALFFGAVMVLIVIWFSPTARSILKLKLSRYFFTHRHDYREQWMRFAEALSSPATGSSLRERAFRAVAEVVESPGGGLWLRESDLLVPVAGGAPGEDGEELAADHPFVGHVEEQRGGIIEFGMEESGLRLAPWLPEWLRVWRDAWLVVPLVHGDRTIGFIVLRRTPGRRSLSIEDDELLSTVARHVSSYLAAEQTTRRLEEERRFEELSRGMAYIAHDLRNLANELALTLANARKHLQNPDFQRDLMISMEDSVAGIQRLLDKLRERQQDRSHESTDFVEIVERSLRRRGDARPNVELDVVAGTSLPVACDPDRLVSMSGHLIQNAVDAAGPGGRVTVRLRCEEGRSLFEVEDNGPGMTSEFLRERLLHPFRSSKRKGFGIGLYECRQLARALGGGLAIESQPGEGTVARLWLPLATGAESALAREKFDAER